MRQVKYITPPQKMPLDGKHQEDAAQYNFAFYDQGIFMEAERINAVANRISNLKMRALELRRYL